MAKKPVNPTFKVGLRMANDPVTFAVQVPANIYMAGVSGFKPEQVRRTIIRITVPRTFREQGHLLARAAAAQWLDQNIPGKWEYNGEPGTIDEQFVFVNSRIGWACAAIIAIQADSFLPVGNIPPTGRK